MRRIIAGLLLCIAGLGVGVDPAVASDATYDALRGARIDGRSLDVSGIEFRRDVHRFTFESGTVHLLAPVNERTFGGVFLGRGRYTLDPATSVERRHLANLLQDPNLETFSETFDTLVFLFTDGTDKGFASGKEWTEGPPDPGASRAYEAFLKTQRKKLKTNLHLRILQDRHNGGKGVFLAHFDGSKYRDLVVAVDPLGVESTRLRTALGAEESALFSYDDERYGIWYLSHLAAEVRAHVAHACRPKDLVDVLHYVVETRVAKNADLGGTTTIRFKPKSTGLRVLPLGLLPKLRVIRAEWLRDAEQTVPIDFVQEDEKEDSDLALILPEPLEPGENVELRVEYDGEGVLSDVGDGNYVVGARTSWYPSFSVFRDRATFELSFDVPAGNSVISVTEPVSAETVGARHRSAWKSERPIAVAGFNYGKFKSIEEQDDVSNTSVQVFTNPGTPDIIEEINLASRSTGMGSYPGQTGAEIVETVGYMDTSTLAQAAMADALNGMKVYTTVFGPLDQKRLAITQQSQWTFGQAWPTLVFMPYLAFTDSTLRQNLGLTRYEAFLEEVGLHEVAHQWWGHRVGWESYRDQWLSEGFAEFSSALAIQQIQGGAAYDEFWAKRRAQIGRKLRAGTMRNFEAGPMTQGYRLQSKRAPGAYQAMVYAKGGFVLHMLRSMMAEPKAQNPDERFFTMLRDFAERYSGKNPSTHDFKTHVERHMVPELNATSNGKMDWFFDQWVYGTEIPRYDVNLNITKAGKGKFRIEGSVSQSGVSDSFLAMVPLYLDLGKGQLARIAKAPFKGTTTQQLELTVELPRKPKRALVNAHHEVLSRDD